MVFALEGDIHEVCAYLLRARTQNIGRVSQKSELRGLAIFVCSQTFTKVDYDPFL